jgi:hypothetical protein
VQPALTLAMSADGDRPPTGWTPMPGPAGGGAGRPPFPVNLTAGERAHPEAFDVLDFELFSRQHRSRPGDSHAPYIGCRQETCRQGQTSATRSVGRPGADDGVLALPGIAKAGES